MCGPLFTHVRGLSQGTGAGFITGLLFFVMFAMYGIGFWFGGKMIADSTDKAMEDYPIPTDFFDKDDADWDAHRDVVDLACFDPDGKALTGSALDTCACGIFWEGLDMVSPNCGCGYTAGTFSVESVCFTGGKTILVFFSILVGGFGLGTAGPGAKELGKARIAAAKMLEVIERKPQVNIDKPGKKITSIKGDLELKNVHFHYKKKGGDNSVQAVFGGVDLKIPAGKTVALVGESGCGKSTIAKLLQRFYDPNQGEILLDGQDISSLDLRDLRSNIGVVSQEPLLFNTSVMDNIRNGKPDATDAEVIAAAKMANAHTFIDQFPDKYLTSVGPKGSKLSGGQKQRVAIARAILRNPAILILDEATSALDNESEKIVQKALDDLLASSTGGDRTTIVIAHRLSTVRSADIIVVLGNPDGMTTAKGSVIMEQGTHDELIKIKGGMYAALASAGEGGVESTEDSKLAAARSMSLDEERLSEIKMESERQKSKDGEEDEENKEKSCMEMCGRGKKDEKDEEDKFEMPKNRIWEYSKSEYGWIAFGSFGSLIKGAVLPAVSVAFARMISCWYQFDTAGIRNDSLYYSYWFYGLAALNLITETIQKGVFEMVGERLTRRLRSDLFRGILRQDVTWFEDEKNSVGVLMSNLSTDVK